MTLKTESACLIPVNWRLWKFACVQQFMTDHGIDNPGSPNFIWFGCTVGMYRLNKFNIFLSNGLKKIPLEVNFHY